MAKKAKKAKKAKTAKKATGTTRAAMAARSITVKAKENPRRKGTDAFKFFEAMMKSPTVGDYSKRFKGDPKTARDASLWLSTSARQGHIKVGAPVAQAAA